MPERRLTRFGPTTHFRNLDFQPLKDGRLEFGRELANLYAVYHDAHNRFTKFCDQHPDHPIVATWLKPCTRAKSARNHNRPVATRSESIPSRDDGSARTYFVDGQPPPYEMLHGDEAKSFKGKIPAEICSAFEDKQVRNELARLGPLLESEVFADVFPQWYPVRPLESANNPASDWDLNLDGRACTIYHRIASEGKKPTATRLARELGCNRQSLYRCRELRRLLNLDEGAAKAPNAKQRPRDTARPKSPPADLVIFIARAAMELGTLAVTGAYDVERM